MRLRRLETYGFKSFADRMSFDFEDGITAVVGPNGCGKSNIVDSIKWVIGEQSAKALRGSEMTDVIFNGCATRRPMSFCEVTLVLDQIGGVLGVEGDECGITRRLFRDGSSQYFINGKSCRLKDIRELFMDTGVGTAAYSVIEQGRVGFILEANTKERRLILEEAAGISKYKARRKLALRKLERVQFDLERIGQVLGEARRRTRAVQKQAAAALRWQELTGQSKELRLAFALEEFGRLSGERTTAETRITELTSAAAEAAAQLATREAGLAEADAKLVEYEAALRESEQTRGEAMSRRDVAGHKAQDAKYRAVELDQQEADDRRALDQFATRISQLADEIAKAEQQVQAADAGQADTDLSASMRQRRTDLDTAMAEVDRCIRAVETAKGKQVECLRELSRVEAECARLDSSRGALAERRRRVEERSGGAADQLANAAIAERTATEAVAQAITTAAAAHGALDERIRAREEALADGNRLDSELNDIRHQEARAETVLRMLQDQERRAEGVFRGVKDVLQQMDRFPGVVGMIADLVKIQDAHVVAIETALGGAAQNIVTETQQAAREAIDFLKRERRGRATFLPLDDIQGGERVPREVVNARGAVGIASQLIDCERRFRPAIEFLLGNVLVVETLDDAIAIRRQYRTMCRLVTLDGDVIAPGGAMTGGRQQGNDGGIVSRKAEIAKQTEALSALAARKVEVGQGRDAAKKKSFELSLAVEEQRRVISAADRTAADAKAKLMGAERDRLHLDEAVGSVGAELEEIAAEMARLESESRDLSGQREWFTTVDQKAQQEIAVLTAELDARAAVRDRLQGEVNELRVSLATTHERAEAARNQLSYLIRSRQEAEDQQGERTRRLADIERKRQELALVRTESERVHADAAAEVERLAAAVNELVRVRDATREASEGDRQEARRLQGRLRGVEAEKSQVEIKANEARVRIENLASRIRDDFQIDLAEAFGHWQKPADFDWSGARQKLTKLDEEIAAIGPVNLAAIDELNDVQSREEYLAKNHADLGTAAEKLAGIIEHINDVSRKLFEATYKQVRANFQALFRKLFGGGSADLKLERWEIEVIPDPEGGPPREVKKEVDVLEAGLEIVAQPPGKNPKIITQLSGGEKALTAIALLFAVYRTKPSPFCVLDEVDAPLDEANVDVYNSMLREFTQAEEGRQGSQFIVITHKKRTMQRADAIYGVTQNERGVSTKISVKFEDVDHVDAQLAPTARGAGPFAPAVEAVPAPV